jgi:hypothetical protein
VRLTSSSQPSGIEHRGGARMRVAGATRGVPQHRLYMPAVEHLEHVRIHTDSRHLTANRVCVLCHVGCSRASVY